MIGLEPVLSTIVKSNCSAKMPRNTTAFSYEVVKYLRH